MVNREVTTGSHLLPLKGSHAPGYHVYWDIKLWLASRGLFSMVTISLTREPELAERRRACARGDGAERAGRAKQGQARTRVSHLREKRREPKAEPSKQQGALPRTRQRIRWSQAGVFGHR